MTTAQRRGTPAADTARETAREGRDTQASRNAMVVARRQAKADPDSVTAQGVRIIDRAEGRNKGGRPKGSKGRPPAEKIAHNVRRALARKPTKWWDKLTDENPYIAAQLIKHVTPPERPALDNADGLHVTVEYVEPEGFAPHDGGFVPPGTKADPDGELVARATSADGSNVSAPGQTAPQLTPAMILEAAKRGPAGEDRTELRKLIEDTAKELELDLRMRTRHMRDEARRLEEALAHANRLRLLDDDRAWEGN